MKMRLLFILFVSISQFTSLPSQAAHNAASHKKTKIRKVAQQEVIRDHLILMVFDQMRPDYIDRYGLQNFRRLRTAGTNYPNAYVGHMGAETVVSHFVISSGLAPREMPWQDEVFQDTQNFLGNGNGAFYTTGGLSQDQLMTLMNRVDQTRLLPAKIKRRYSDSKTFAVGVKAYAAITFGTSQADSIISFRKTNGICTPTGHNVPNYITSNNRYTVDCRDPFGTQGSLYPLDGSRSVPGHDQAHLGGDVWVADVAREIMEHEPNWRGLFLTFAGIDKVGHLMGDIDVAMPHSFDSQYSLEDALRIADAQLGRILEKLEEHGLTNRTLIVVTADHGAQSNTVYLGNGQKSHGGQDLVNDRSSPQAYFVDRLIRTNRVRVTYQDTAMRLWLSPIPEQAPVEGQPPVTSDDQLIRMMSETSGLVEIYKLTETNGRYSYTRVFQNLTNQPRAFRAWAIAHNQELVNTMAAAGAPDLIGLLADGFGFDLPGDHGGAQERVQRIPVIFKGPGISASSEIQSIRLMDLNNKITRLMDL